MLPPAHTALDSSRIAAHYQAGLSGQVGEPEILAKLVYMELKLRLPEHLLMRVDKLTMAHSVEARVPFLDHEVVDFARRLPPAYKLDNGVGKRVVKKAAEPYLPHDLIYRKKQGFGAPVERWLKDPGFAGRLRALISRSRLFREGLMDGNYFRGLFEREVAASGGHSFHIWTVINLLLWHEHWIDGRDRF